MVPTYSQLERASDVLELDKSNICDGTQTESFLLISPDTLLSIAYAIFILVYFQIY